MRLSGFAVAPGRVIGKAFVFQRAERQVPYRSLEKGAASGEKERLQTALSLSLIHISEPTRPY